MRPLTTRHVLSPLHTIAVIFSFCGLGLADRVLADWPHLRGPAFDGSAPNGTISLPWPEHGPPLLWEHPLGQGYAAFTLAGNRAYTLYQSAFSQNLACLDADSGQIVWEFPCGSPFEPLGLYPGPRSTPTLAEGRILFVTPDAHLYCVDADRGDEVWSVNMKKEFAGRGTEFGYSASPLVFDGKVILPVGGANAAVVAFALKSGRIVWQSGSHPASYASIVPIRLEGTTLLLAAMRNHMLLLHPETGRIAWENEVSLGYDEHSISPLYEEPILVLTAPFRSGATALRLSLQDVDAGTASKPESGPDSEEANGGGARRMEDVDSADGLKVRAEHLWHSREFSNDVLASAIVNGTIYGFDLRDQQAKAHRSSRGLFRCLDLPTGKTLWSSDRPGHSNVLRLPSEGRLLLFNDEGELIVLKANREAYEELARHPVFDNEICWTFPALSDGRVLLRTQFRAAALQIGPHSSADTALATSVVPASRPMRRFWNRFRLGMLLGGEREHPFMQPAPDELSRWFWWSLTVVALPACAWACLADWCRPRGPRPGPASDPATVKDAPSIHLLRHFVEAGLWIGLGLVMTPILNLPSVRGEPLEGHDPFILTWPAALFGGLLLVGLTSRIGNRWVRRGGDVGFLLLCLIYFLVLRSQSLPHEWAFLIGLVPAIPFAWAWSRSRASETTTEPPRGWQAHPIVGSLIATLGFTALFWTPFVLRLLRGSLVDVIE